MFDLDQFAADCRAALAEDKGGDRAVREVVASAVSNPSCVLAGLGEPRRGEIQKLYHAPDLTILNVIWGPLMTIMPHNHRLWAVIGIYTGCEDNIFWRRVDVGKDIIHSVTNPIPRLTGAIHVYGGDFFGIDRSEWDPETLHEQRYDVDRAMRLFEESNAAVAIGH